MSTFEVLIECLPFLAFVGFGLYLLLTALFPSWREKNWKHWKFYGIQYGNFTQSTYLNSSLQGLGFAKQRKPVSEETLTIKQPYCCITFLAQSF